MKLARRLEKVTGLHHKFCCLETISNRVLAANHFWFSHTASGISAVFWTSFFSPGCQSSNLLRNSSFRVLTRTWSKAYFRDGCCWRTRSWTKIGIETNKFWQFLTSKWTTFVTFGATKQFANNIYPDGKPIMWHYMVASPVLGLILSTKRYKT